MKITLNLTFILLATLSISCGLGVDKTVFSERATHDVSEPQADPDSQDAAHGGTTIANGQSQSGTTIGNGTKPSETIHQSLDLTCHWSYADESKELATGRCTLAENADPNTHKVSSWTVRMSDTDIPFTVVIERNNEIEFSISAESISQITVAATVESPESFLVHQRIFDPETVASEAEKSIQSDNPEAKELLLRQLEESMANNESDPQDETTDKSTPAEDKKEPQNADPAAPEPPKKALALIGADQFSQFTATDLSDSVTMSVSNYSQSGMTISGALERISDVNNPVDLSKADIVYLSLGMNDIKHLFTDLAIAVHWSNYQRLIDTIKSKAPGAEIIVQTVLPMRRDGGGLLPFAPEATIAYFNLGLRTISNNKNVRFADTFSGFLWQGRLTDMNLFQRRSDDYRVGTNYSVLNEAGKDKLKTFFKDYLMKP